MHKQVETYLQEKKREAQRNEQSYREKLLIEEGLYVKAYVEETAEDATWDDSLFWDSDKKQYYKKVAITVSDEEFAQIEKCAQKTPCKEEEKGMFANIGTRIMDLAQMICWLGIIGSVMAGIIMMVSDEDLVPYGLLVAILGSLGSWVGSWFAYAFGNLVENVRQIKENTKKE